MFFSLIGGKIHPISFIRRLATRGCPDGRTKTQVCDLASKLPAGTRRLRLTTSFQIYWDRIALMKRRGRVNNKRAREKKTPCPRVYRDFTLALATSHRKITPMKG